MSKQGVTSEKSTLTDGLIHPLGVREEQLVLDIPRSRLEFWFNIKNSLHNFEKTFGAIPFWKHLLSVFTFVTILFSFIISVSTFYILSNRMPVQIPLIYSQTISNWELVQKESVYILALFLFVSELFVFYLSSRLYNFDRRLYSIICSSLIMLSVFYLIAFWQICLLLLA